MTPSPFAVKAGSLTACPSCTDVQPATTTTDNAKAIACYQRCGFQITGTEHASLAWEGRYYDELLMSRWLSNGGVKNG